LQAIEQGHWVILKNLNLANQNILEGLNSILDHRQEIFIPEISKTIKNHEKCRIFAVQNPMAVGGGRKGLPGSFLNRFIRMYFPKFKKHEIN
jgi:midasin